jgi:hypothetical protein
MAGVNIEISVRGEWVRVPALDIDGNIITVKGKWIRIAAIHDEWWLKTEIDDPATCVRKLKAQKSQLRADIFTFTQKVPGSSPKYPYVFESESVAAARTSSFKTWWESLPQESRKNVRRSQKRGVVVRLEEFNDELIGGIAGVNNDSPIKQGERNVHCGKSLALVRKDHESFRERSDFICAYFENEMIGYLKVVYRGEVAAILNLGVKVSHSDKRPANALIAAAVKRCEQEGVSYLTYGLYNYGNKRHSPLCEFKARNGFKEMLTPRFYLPLSLWGEISMKAKLHRGLIGILPNRLIQMGIHTRTRWYNFRQSLSRCSLMSERPTRTRQMERSIPPAGSKS